MPNCEVLLDALKAAAEDAVAAKAVIEGVREEQTQIANGYGEEAQQIQTALTHLDEKEAALLAELDVLDAGASEASDCSEEQAGVEAVQVRLDAARDAQASAAAEEEAAWNSLLQALEDKDATLDHMEGIEQHIEELEADIRDMEDLERPDESLPELIDLRDDLAKAQAELAELQMQLSEDLHAIDDIDGNWNTAFAALTDANTEYDAALAEFEDASERLQKCEELARAAERHIEIEELLADIAEQRAQLEGDLATANANTLDHRPFGSIYEEAMSEVTQAWDAVMQKFWAAYKDASDHGCIDDTSLQPEDF